MTEHVFADASAQARAAADRIAEALSEGGALVATGGSTPGPLYDALSARDLPWGRISVTLSDERWVPPGHADSNERLVRERLMRGPAAAAAFIPLKTPDPTPQAAAPKVEAALAAMPRPFACVLLGMARTGTSPRSFPATPRPRRWTRTPPPWSSRPARRTGPCACPCRCTRCSTRALSSSSSAATPSARWRGMRRPAARPIFP